MRCICGTDLTTFNCASKEIEALTDLWLKAMQDFIDYYKSIPEELLTKGMDDEGENALFWGRHTMGCVLGHFKWSLELSGLPGPDLQSSLLKNIVPSDPPARTRQLLMEEAERLMKVIPALIAPMTNDHLSHQGTTTWGENMSSEGMIEHTIVHLYRHMRQLKVRLYQHP